MKISLKSHHRRAWRGESETNLCLFINRCEHWVREGRESEGAYYKFYTTKSKSESNEGRKKRNESVARKKTFPSLFFWLFMRIARWPASIKKKHIFQQEIENFFLTLDRHRPHPFHKFLFLFSTAPKTDRKEITVKIFPFKDQKSTRLTTIVSLSQTSQFFLFTSSFSTP